MFRKLFFFHIAYSMISKSAFQLLSHLKKTQPMTLKMKWGNKYNSWKSIHFETIHKFLLQHELTNALKKEKKTNKVQIENEKQKVFMNTLMGLKTTDHHVRFRSSSSWSIQNHSIYLNASEEWETIPVSFMSEVEWIVLWRCFFTRLI